jgi:hypothetical protein
MILEHSFKGTYVHIDDRILLPAYLLNLLLASICVFLLLM